MIPVQKNFDEIPKGLTQEKNEQHLSVRDKLTEIYHGKCAYSEEKLDITQGHINHYRPVSLYPWLKYEWSNLHLCCPSCNMAAANRFPIAGTKLSEPPTDHKEWCADSRSLLGEKPLLLNPEIDTPENHLYFDPNGIIYGRTDRGRETIQVFNLNREELIIKRKEKIDSFIKEFEKILESYAKLDRKKGSHYYKGKLIYKTLFEKVFIKLKQAGEPQAEFSLLGRNMLEYFDLFFGDYFSWDKAKSKEKEKLLQNFQQMLANAAVFFTKTDDIIILNKVEKKVPFFPKDGASDKRMEKGLPLAIKAFEIRKYHGIKFAYIENLPIDTRWIFLTGDNSAGKTLVLQALVMGLLGKKDGDIELADENCRIKLELKIEKENIINIVPGYLRKRVDNFAAYGPGRLNIDGDVFEGRQAPEKVRKTASIFQNDSSLFNIQEYLIQIHGRKEFETKFNAIIKTLKQLLPWVEDIVIDDSAEKKKVLYRERTEDGQVLKEVPFGALSAGSKSIVATIGDMLIELLKNQDDPSELAGIVIIDEIDIHLHVKWQREFVTRLTRLFPKIQFIASTHSPIPLLGAPAETVILNLEKENKQDGIVIKRLHIDVTELTPNTILTSPIFDFDWIIPAAHGKNGKKAPLYTQDKFPETVFNKMLKERLKKLAREGGTSLAKLMKEDTVDKSR